MAMDLVVLLSSGVVLHNCPVASVLHSQRPECNTNIPHLPPELTPRVTHDPVPAGLLISPPSHHRNDVVNRRAAVLNHSRLVVQQRAGVNPAGNRATVVDLLHHRVLPLDRPVVRNCHIREVSKPAARASLRGKATASTSNIDGLAARIHVRAESLLGVRRASLVGVRCLVAQTVAIRRLLGQPLVHRASRSTIAASGIGAVQNVLHRQIDVDALASTSDLHTISKSRHSPVSPARATVLRNVLVPTHRAVVHSVLVAPSEGIRILHCSKKLIVGVRVVPTPHVPRSLDLLLGVHLAATSQGTKHTSGKNTHDRVTDHNRAHNFECA
mmetsp:Transcript_93000/g.248919  ORF Transcript_93000/g.248919 Transcript_93000/m.248919 type:complete len:327 (-) Transcript_93000:39-1019(-)